MSGRSGRPIRVGFVGAGAVATRHARTLLDLGDARVVAVADPATERARELAAMTGAAAYPDWRELLDRERLDALYICVPPFAHGEPELAAVAAGLPFFVEKPLALDLATAERVAAAVRRAGLVTATGFHWRALDTVARARELLRDRPARLLLGYWLDRMPPAAWWRRRDRSGGQMLEQAVHVLDLARVLVGEVTAVHALGSRAPWRDDPDGDVDDAATASLAFASGAVGSVSATCLLGWHHRMGLALFAEGLAVELTEDEMTVRDAAGETFMRADGSAKARTDRDFLDAVRGDGNRVRAPYQEALGTQRLGYAIARSAEERRPVLLDQAGMVLG